MAFLYRNPAVRVAAVEPPAGELVQGLRSLDDGFVPPIFERGIPIGQVESVGSQEVEVYQSIAVKPFVDFRKLDLVQVITR